MTHEASQFPLASLLGQLLPQVETPAGPPADAYSLTSSDWVAAATDRGMRKPTNQDAVRIGARDRTRPRPSAVLVVSDGVSTSLGSDVAARRAADTACDHLVAFLTEHPLAETGEIEQALLEAFASARQRAQTVEDGRPAGSCTLIAAVVAGGSIVVANIGDCRSYWIGDDGSGVVLSTDDSVAQARILMGVPRDEAERGFQAHAITNWLGPSSPHDPPTLRTFLAPGAGWLVVCSDGLWNYASAPDALASALHESDETGAPVDLASGLVHWANAQGGHDNISVAVARIDGPQPPLSEQPDAELSHRVG
ncbi:MAG TPA: PP2C family protein-serine/threonine phosphatase [Propionibacteriaceae bacterium]|nr:PP2C family protein-serine/threonine phosphatase [Propionibacteriaceae bacterium]